VSVAGGREPGGPSQHLRCHEPNAPGQHDRTETGDDPDENGEQQPATEIVKLQTTDKPKNRAAHLADQRRSPSPSFSQTVLPRCRSPASAAARPRRQRTFPTTRQALVPPKPNEFVRATRTGSSRAS